MCAATLRPNKNGKEGDHMTYAIFGIWECGESDVCVCDSGRNREVKEEESKLKHERNAEQVEAKKWVFLCFCVSDQYPA